MARRFVLLLMVAMMAATMTAVPAFATHQPNHPGGGGDGGGNLPPGCTRDGGQVTCLTAVERTVEETVELSQRTEFRENPAVAPCTVGQSHRVGTQQGIETQEVLITTFGVYEVTLRDVTTTVYQGNPQAGQVVSETTETTEIDRTLLRTFEEEDVVDTTFTPTGPCRNVPGPQNAQA